MKTWEPEEIKIFRKALGLTQAKFADVLGVTRVYVVYLERGDRRPGKTMKRLLDCLERHNENGKGKE
jgi:DNA-binding transcriptional regulator YiaG